MYSNAELQKAIKNGKGETGLPVLTAGTGCITKLIQDN